MASPDRGPRGLKGALVSIDPDTGLPNVIAFQYNPAAVRRSLRPLTVGGEAGDRSQAVRLTGPPEETLSLEVEMDAADGLETGDPQVLRSGLAPRLATLQLLSFPPSSRVALDRMLLEAGTIEIAPTLAPRLLFVWGASRVQPVQIASLTIAEEEFDTRLNPIRATISLELKVLTYADLAQSSPDHQQSLAYQQALEALAAPTRSADGAPTGATWR